MAAWGSLHELDIETGGERTWELHDESISAGRLTNTQADEKLTVKWAKAFVSGHHFSIKRSEDGAKFEISDGSSNGTFVNDVLVGRGKSLALHSGDRIQLRFKKTDKIILTFSVHASDCRPKKRQRSPLQEDSRILEKKDIKRGRQECNISIMKITALEQENKQQEARIEAYIVKLESSTRENSNLLRDLNVAQEAIRRKDADIEELKQHVNVLEVNNTAIEARARNLEESVKSYKIQCEQLRGELSKCENRATEAGELILKVETLTDELSRRKNQFDAQATMCDELARNFECERLLAASLQQEVDEGKRKLSMLQKESIEYREINSSLTTELQSTRKLLNSSLIKVDIFSNMARQVKSEEEEFKRTFTSKLSRIGESLDILLSDTQSFSGSFASHKVCASVDACLSSIESLQSDGSPLFQSLHQHDGEYLFQSTQMQTPNAAEKTAGNDITSSSIVVNNSQFNHMVLTTQDSSDLSKIRSSAENNNRQNSMLCDTVGLTYDDDIDMKKIEHGVSAQHTETANINMGFAGKNSSVNLGNNTLAENVGDDISAGKEKLTEVDHVEVREFTGMSACEESVRHTTSCVDQCNDIASSSDESSMVISRNRQVLEDNENYDVDDESDIVDELQ